MALVVWHVSHQNFRTMNQFVRNNIVLKWHNSRKIYIFSGKNFSSYQSGSQEVQICTSFGKSSKQILGLDLISNVKLLGDIFT